MNSSAVRPCSTRSAAAHSKPVRAAPSVAPAVRAVRPVAAAPPFGESGLPSPGTVPVTRYDKVIDSIEKQVDKPTVVPEERTKTVMDQVAREVERTEYVDVERKDIVVDQVEKEVTRTEIKNVPRTKEVVDEVQREIEVVEYVPVTRKETVTDEVVRQVAYNEQVPVERKETVIEEVERVVPRMESVPITRKEIVVEEVPREVTYTEDVAVHRPITKVESVERVQERTEEEQLQVLNEAVIPNEKLVEKTQLLEYTTLEKVDQKVVLDEARTVTTNFEQSVAGAGTSFSERTNISGPGAGGMSNAEGVDKFSAEFKRPASGILPESERVRERELVARSDEGKSTGRSDEATFVSHEEMLEQQPNAVVEDMSADKPKSIGQAIKDLLS